MDDFPRAVSEWSPGSQEGASEQSPELRFLTGGGEMGERLRAHDWFSSPLGAPDGWPQSLRSTVGLLLSSKFPMFLAWGPELTFIYNDSYIDIWEQSIRKRWVARSTGCGRRYGTSFDLSPKGRSLARLPFMRTFL
jgi:hypothetical protein